MFTIKFDDKLSQAKRFLSRLRCNRFAVICAALMFLYNGNVGTVNLLWDNDAIYDLSTCGFKFN